MKIRIVVDCTVLAQGIKTGVYRVAHELVCYLANADEIELIVTVTREEFFNGQGVDLRAGLADYLAEINIDVRFVDSRIDPAFVGADFFITPFFKVPDNWAEESRVQKVAIAYDLIAINNPEFFERNIIELINEFYQQVQPDWLVLAISHSTKQDLLKHRPDLFAENIVVTYLGADAGYKANISHEQIAQSKAKYGVPSDVPYLLSVATLEIRKNLETAVSAFAAYIRQSGDQTAMLVLAGMKGWKLDLLESEIDKRPDLSGRVVLTGFVDEGDLPALYAGATGFVYLSHYEGFGLPPLEAMSCGVPVITSNTSSIPEVVGDAGIMLAPDDEVGVANAYDQLLNKPGIRQHYSTLALQQAGQFSWTKFGQDVLAAISEFQVSSSSPFLSIITICYNEPHIKDTCESIRQQAFDGFEWIVIDGGSNDGTREILEQYRGYMTHLVSEPDNGRYDAMNKGIALASGKYLLFLNGGDYLCHKNTLASVFSYSVPAARMSLFQWLPTEGIIYGEVIAKETGMMPYPLWRTGEQCHDIDFFAGASLPHQATFIRRTLFKQFGVYNDTLKYAADYEWFIRVIVLNNVATQYLPLAVSVYNFEGASSTSNTADKPHIKEIQAIYRHYSAPANSIAYPGLKWIAPSFADAEQPTAMAQCRYADIDYGRSVLDMVLPRLTDQEINRVLANIEQARSSHFVLCQQIFLKQIRSEKLPLATLITYVHRLVRQHHCQSNALERVPYERVLRYVEERLLQRIEWFTSHRMQAVAKNPVAGDDPIKSQNYLAEGHSLGDFKALVVKSEKGQTYARNRQDANAFALAIDPNNPPPIMADQYLMAQKALRRLARKNKYNKLIAAKGNS